MLPEIHIDLGKSPSNRWHLSPIQQEQARQLLTSYLADIGGVHQFSGMLTQYAELFMQPDHLEEIKSLAEIVNCSVEEALLVNLYYDAIKLVMGCTAFAVDTPDGPLHARNLDWWTENAMLTDYTTITHYSGGYNTFKTVGWSGYIGALSGVAPDRFAITLNAVLSNDPPAFAKPISLFLRSVFETAKTYAEAVDLLMSEEIASDCLLLISGINAGEMAVIERTPTRSAIRHPENGFITVANDYIALDSSEVKSTSQLQTTSCGRFEKATEHLTHKLPTSPADCFAILQDSSIQMNITVQQMVFSAKTGEIHVQLPQT